MNLLCRKMLYSLPALLTGPGAVLLLLMFVPSLPAFGAVFIVLGVSTAAMLSVWRSDIWGMPARSYIRRVSYWRAWLAYGASYLVLVVTQSALLITLGWLSLYVSPAEGAQDAMIVAMWFIAGVSASIVAVHLLRAINPAADLRRYLWISLAGVGLLAAADLGLPALKAADMPLPAPPELVHFAKYATLAASLWLAVIANSPYAGGGDDDAGVTYAPVKRETPASTEEASDSATAVRTSSATPIRRDAETRADAALSG